MMVCPLFNDIRSQFILQLNEVEQSFNDYTQEEQFIYVMSNQGFFYRGGRGGIAPPLNWSKSGICIRRHNSTRTI